MDIINAQNISHAFNGMPVLEDICFTVNPGDFTAVLGANGSGKTTLIKIILGLLNCHNGDIKLFGCPLAHFKDWHKIGYLEQKLTPPVLMPITAFEVVKLGLLSTKKHPYKFTVQDTHAISGAMQTTGCDIFKDKLFNQLSGGQQQRVLLSRTIINKPQLLILDEPSTALDSLAREQFFELIHHLNQQQKTTILLITHDSGQIGKFVNKFLILDKKIIFYGDKAAFCQSTTVGQYLGHYSQHIIDHMHTHDTCPLGACR